MPIKAEKWTNVDENDENSEEEYSGDYGNDGNSGDYQNDKSSGDYGNDYDYNYGNDYDNDNYYGSVEVKCTNIAGKAFYT